MPTDQLLSAKTVLANLTDDDRVVVINAPGSTANTGLLPATALRTYCQTGTVLATQLGVATAGGVTGVATLDASGKVPTAQLPTLASGVTSVQVGAGTVKTGVVNVTAAEIAALSTGATGAFPFCRIISTDGHTTANTLYVGINDPTSVAGGSFTPIDGDLWAQG